MFDLRVENEKARTIKEIKRRITEILETRKKENQINIQEILIAEGRLESEVIDDPKINQAFNELLKEKQIKLSDFECPTNPASYLNGGPCKEIPVFSIISSSQPHD